MVDAKHFTVIEFLAMGVDKNWEKGMCAWCKPVMSATKSSSNRIKTDGARAWLTSIE